MDGARKKLWTVGAAALIGVGVIGGLTFAGGDDDQRIEIVPVSDEDETTTTEATTTTTETTVAPTTTAAPVTTQAPVVAPTTTEVQTVATEPPPIPTETIPVPETTTSVAPPPTLAPDPPSPPDAFCADGANADHQICQRHVPAQRANADRSQEP